MISGSQLSELLSVAQMPHVSRIVFVDVFVKNCQNINKSANIGKMVKNVKKS